MIEIERKFLTTIPLAEIILSSSYTHSEHIEQCYVLDSGSWAIRARKITRPNDDYYYYFLTMKKRLTDLSSTEIETTVDRRFFEQIREVCGHHPLRKTRWHIGDALFVLDEFHNPELNGLVLAEIELPAEMAAYPRPGWLGEEVTSDIQYRNFKMAERLRFNQTDHQD